MSKFNLYLLITLLLCAVASDIKSRRIPNVLIVAGWLSALVAAVLQGSNTAGSVTSAVVNLHLGLITGFACLLPLYLMRACGAGDVKLMAVVGAFLGDPLWAAYAALYTFAAGGLLSVLFLLRPGVAAKAISNLHFLMLDWIARRQAGAHATEAAAPLINTAARLPYAVAIALGTGVAVWLHLPTS